MFWDKLIKKKEKCTNVTNNFSINNFDYDKLTDDEKEYVNKLINEYITFFDNNNDTSKLDIDIINEIKMCQDLALNIMYKEHLSNIIRSIIDSKKMAYYSHKIDELNNELKYKYFALNRLRKDKKYLAKYMGLYVLGKNKINVIRVLDNQINIINNLLVVTNKNIYDYNSFVLANISNMNKVDIHDELKELFEQVKDDYQKLFNIESNFEKELSITDKIVYLELFIDKFIYENKDLIVKLKEKLDIISNSEIKDKDEQKDIINKLMKIKKYYIIYDRYGRNRISKEEFEELYQIIFNVYTYFADGEEFKKYYLNQTRKCYDMYTKDELLIYDRIINYKLDLLKLKKSTVFNNNDFNSIIINILFEMLDINKKPQERNLVKNLTLLLFLDYENGFDMYFDNVNPINMVYYYKNIPIPYDSNYIKREYYKYIIGNLKDKPSYKGDELDLFYYLYYDKIDFKLLPSLVSNYNLYDYQEYIKDLCLNEIYLPSTAEDILIDLYDISGKKIYLNDKLKDLTIRINRMTDLILFIKPDNLIYLPDNKLNVSIVVNEIIDKYKDTLLYTIDSLLSNIFSNLILPNSLQNMTIEEITEYLTETFNGVYYFIKKMYIHSNDINYDEFYEILKDIFTKMRYYSEYRNGIFPLNEMIETTKDIKYVKKELNVSKEKIIYNAFIDAILYVSNIIDKENHKIYYLKK